MFEEKYMESLIVNSYANEKDNYPLEFMCAELLIAAICEYLYLYLSPDDYTCENARKMFNEIIFDDDNPHERDAFDMLFSEVAIKDPCSTALVYYRKYKKCFYGIRKKVCMVLKGS